MSRYFNYLENNLEFKEAFDICKKIIKDILDFELDLLTAEQKNIILKIKNRALILQKNMSFSPYEINNKILNDLLEPQNVEYAFKYSKYPINASKTGESINKLFMEIFELEDKMQTIVADLWNRIITPFDRIKNGEKFIAIGHSGSGYIILPQSKYYRDNEYNNTETYSCSVFSPNSMNCFNSKLVIIFDVDLNNFISATYFDSATRTSNTKSIKTLERTDSGILIEAGYSNPSKDNHIVTKSEYPLTVLSKIEKEKTKINEVVLDKQKSNPTGLLLFSNGSDFLFFEYLDALKMKNEYNLKFKVINKSLYMDLTISPENLNDALLNFEEYIINMNLDHNEIYNLLDSYINEVVKPLKLTPIIENMQIQFIENLKEKLKKLTK